MRDAYNKYQADGFVVLAVSIQESNTAVDGFIAQHGLENTFLMDGDGTISRDYNIYTTPTTYFIDPKGVVVDILPGVLSAQWVDQQMAQIES